MRRVAKSDEEESDGWSMRDRGQWRGGSLWLTTDSQPRGLGATWMDVLATPFIHFRSGFLNPTHSSISLFVLYQLTI